MIAKSAQ